MGVDVKFPENLAFFEHWNFIHVEISKKVFAF